MPKRDRDSLMKLQKEIKCRKKAQGKMAWRLGKKKRITDIDYTMMTHH